MELRQWVQVRVRLAGDKVVKARVVEISHGTVYVTTEAAYQKMKRIGGEVRPIFGVRIEDVSPREKSA